MLAVTGVAEIVLNVRDLPKCAISSPTFIRSVTPVVRKNSVRLQNQQGTVSLCNVDIDEFPGRRSFCAPQESNQEFHWKDFESDDLLFLAEEGSIRTYMLGGR